MTKAPDPLTLNMTKAPDPLTLNMTKAPDPLTLNMAKVPDAIKGKVCGPVCAFVYPEHIQPATYRADRRRH